MKKNIVVNLLLELIAEERRGPPVTITIDYRHLQDSFDLRLIGTYGYLSENPDCVNNVMNELNKIGINKDIVCNNIDDFIKSFDKEEDPKFLLHYSLIKHIKENFLK